MASDRVAERVHDVVLLADTDLEAGVREAAFILSVADGRVDAVASCERILALAAVRSGDLDAAERHIERATEAAATAGDQAVLGRVLLTAMSVAATAGRFDEALELCDRARPLLPAELAVRADIQRATVLLVSSRVDEAIDAYRSILSNRPDLGSMERAQLQMNLGTQLVRRDDVAEGVHHLRAARATLLELGNIDHATACSLHIALGAARTGDHAAVFETHRALDEAGELASTDPRTLLDLGDCLVAAGLFEEARGLLDRALALVGEGVPSELSVKIELSSASLFRRIGDDRSAATAAADALVNARVLGDAVAIALAMVESLTAAGADDLDDAIRLLLEAANRCRANGLGDAAIDAEIAALEHARNQPDGGRSIAEQIGSGAAIHGSPIRRAQAHHHRALLACCRGRPGAARRSLATGLRILEHSRARLSAADLRAAASDRSPQMAELGLRLAVDVGRPQQVLEWAERLRATALRFSQPPRSSDESFRHDLDALRGASSADAGEAAMIERRIVARQRSVGANALVTRSTSTSKLRDALGSNATLLEYVILDGRLSVVVVDRSGTSLIDLDVAVADVEESLAKLLFGLRRSASGIGPAAESAASMVVTLADRLGAWLVPPVRRDGLVVVVPSGLLHSVPWAAIPSLSGRAFVVAPSAHAWVVADAIVDERQRVLAVSGPGLVEADPEIVDVAASWPSAIALRGGSSTEVVEHLPGTGLVHLCCHGRFRTDSPQFSSFELADGPFTVLDLDGVAELPSIAVLSACELGTVSVRAGDDILGFPAALFARGIRTLVAALVPVEDRAARALMAAMHASLAGGTGAAEALRFARMRVWDVDAAHRAAASSFLCFGAG